MTKQKKIHPVKSRKAGISSKTKLFNRVKITIDGKKITAKSGQTILEAAKSNGIDIPALCYHSDLTARANCRICVVEVKGTRNLQPACRTKIKQGMEIITNSARVRRARKINLELIFAQHVEECDDCVWSFNCQLLKLAKEYKVRITRFPDRKIKKPIYQFGPIVFDQTKCIDCRNCVEMCEKQGVGFLKVKGRGSQIQIVPAKEKNKDCIYCGQCVTHCPVGAIEGVGEFEHVSRPLQEKDKIVVAQFAPAVRTSIGEEFNLSPGQIVTGQIAAGLKKLGFNKVFDVSVGADFTTVEEAQELIERLKNKRNLPMFTSCCPSWVKFVEFYFPEFIPNLTTVRSPHIILGGLIKTYWAEKENINPEKIVVVSIMPCLAKKYEITRPELKINGLKPVDYVLTTRELSYLLIRNKIDLKNIKPARLDSPLGFPSGAGVIYGATGGVMESALRTSYEKLTGKKLLNLEFKQVRGMEEVKTARIKINPVRGRLAKGTATAALRRLASNGVNNYQLKIAAINGTGSAKKILVQLKKNPHLYDYIEVMACPGGCIGGGGQPIPVDSQIRRARANSLYQIDLQKKNRLAHENPEVKKVYQEFLDKEKVHTIFHTK